MNIELTEREARLVRSQLVRYLAELQDEFARTDANALKRALALEIGALRGVYDRLTTMLDSGPLSQSMPAAAPNGRSPG